MIQGWTYTTCDYDADIKSKMATATKHNVEAINDKSLVPHQTVTFTLHLEFQICTKIISLAEVYPSIMCGWFVLNVWNGFWEETVCISDYIMFATVRCWWNAFLKNYIKDSFVIYKCSKNIPQMVLC
jgi:hypothetical protein